MYDGGQLRKLSYSRERSVAQNFRQRGRAGSVLGGLSGCSQLAIHRGV